MSNFSKYLGIWVLYGVSARTTLMYSLFSGKLSDCMQYWMCAVRWLFASYYSDQESKFSCLLLLQIELYMPAQCLRKHLAPSLKVKQDGIPQLPSCVYVMGIMTVNLQ